MATIYGLYCECHPHFGVRYIGQTTAEDPRKRLSQHIRSARNSIRTHKDKWIRKHQFDIEMVELEWVPDSKRLDREAYWIDVYRAAGCELVNATSGEWIKAKDKRIATFKKRDEPFSPELREKISRAVRDSLEKNPRPRSVSSEQDAEIRKLYDSGMSQRSIAKMLGVGRAVIRVSLGLL